MHQGGMGSGDGVGTGVGEGTLVGGAAIGVSVSVGGTTVVGAAVFVGTGVKVTVGVKVFVGAGGKGVLLGGGGGTGVLLGGAVGTVPWALAAPPHPIASPASNTTARTIPAATMIRRDAAKRARSMASSLRSFRSGPPRWRPESPRL